METGNGINNRQYSWENTILIIADAGELYPSIPQDNGVKSL